MHLRLVVPALLLVAIPAAAGGGGTSGAVEGPGGAFTCDFGLPPDMPLEDVGPTIERDRMYMAERPGMVHKHIPFRPDPANERLLSGGRYLFDTEENARDYLRWMREDFALGGVLFLDRPEFLAPDCHAWRAIGSAQFADIHTSQTTLRTERWHAPQGANDAFLAAKWPGIRDEAEARGYSAVWLLSQPEERLVSIVSIAPPLTPAPVRPDLSLVVLEASPTMGPAFDAAGWARTLDRTTWSLNIWFPYAHADGGEAALWPNSPPLPAPTTTDGVCVPSRGETHATAPDDCTPLCGDGIQDADETWERCPSDVRYDW